MAEGKYSQNELSILSELGPFNTAAASAADSTLKLAQAAKIFAEISTIQNIAGGADGRKEAWDAAKAITTAAERMGQVATKLAGRASKLPIE